MKPGAFDGLTLPNPDHGQADATETQEPFEFDLQGSGDGSTQPSEAEGGDDAWVDM